MNNIDTNAELTDIDTDELDKIEGGMFGLADCPGWVVVGAVVTLPAGAPVAAYCLIAWL